MCIQNLDEFGPVVTEISNKKKFCLCACALWVSCKIYNGIFARSTWVWIKVNHDTIPFKRHLHLQINTLKLWIIDLICIVKMTSYDLGLILRNDSLIINYLHRKFGRIWTSACWDTEQREVMKLCAYVLCIRYEV